MDDPDDDSKSKMDRLMDFAMFWFSILLALVLVFVILFAGGWIFQVLFGKMTTSEYLSMWTAPVLHPENTGIGRWIQGTLHRARN